MARPGTTGIDDVQRHRCSRLADTDQLFPCRRGARPTARRSLAAAGFRPRAHRLFHALALSRRQFRSMDNRAARRPAGNPGGDRQHRAVPLLLAHEAAALWAENLRPRPLPPPRTDLDRPAVRHGHRLRSGEPGLLTAILRSKSLDCRRHSRARRRDRQPLARTIAAQPAQPVAMVCRAARAEAARGRKRDRARRPGGRAAPAGAPPRQARRNCSTSASASSISTFISADRDRRSDCCSPS